jgi:long-chain acyl-CoA synthetase
VISGVANIFCLHSKARAFGADGQALPLGHIEPLIAPGPAALSSVFLTAREMSFRVGGEGLPEGGIGWFETLTGGSTGTPRRILRRQSSWTASFAINAGLFAIGPGASVAAMGDLIHSLALYAGVEALHLGADFHHLQGLSPKGILRAIAERGITHLYATPAQLRLLAGQGASVSIRHLIIGGGAMDAGLALTLATAFPSARITGFYGAAEASFITLSDATTPQGDAGKPYPGVTLHLRDPDPQGIGEIWVESPYLAAGYAGTQGSGRWDGGKVTAGEWGRILPSGDLVILGRGSRRIRIADQSLFPEEVETFLLSQPGIRQAALLPQPDPARGQVPVAILQGQGQDQPLCQAIRDRFGPLAVPRRILWWEGDWPMLTSGKTDFSALARALE